MFPALRPEAGDPLGEVRAALAVGEPQRAERLLAELSASPVPDAARLRWLAWSLSAHWWPGPVGANVDDPPPAPTEPGEPDDPLPTALTLSALATGGWRAGPVQAETYFRTVVAPRLDRWYRSAAESGDALATGRVALLCAELGRRAGLEAFARQALDDAAAAGPALDGPRRLAEGDALLTPRASPEALGFDLEQRGAPPVIGDAAARVAAAEHYRAARSGFARLDDLDGCAAVDLRLAWLSRLDGDHDRCAGLLAAVSAGAGATRVLGLTHRAVADLAAGSTARTRPGPTAEIVAWARGPGSRSFAIGCAGIVHATACAAREAGAVEAALAAFDLAARLMSALGDRTGGLILASDLGALYDRLGSAGAAIVTVEEAVAAATAPHGGLDAEGPIDILDWQRIGDGLMSLVNRHVTEEDADGLVALAQRLTRLLARAPGGPRDALAPATDFAAVMTEAGHRLAELGAARAGPLGGGLPWAEMEAAHVDLTVAALSTGLAMCEMMAHRFRAEQASVDDDAASASREYAAALAAAGPGRELMLLTVLASAGRTDELRSRTAAFLATSPAIDAETVATLWVNAEEFDRAHAALAAAGRTEPEPAPPDWRPSWDGGLLRARIALGRDRPDEARAFVTEAARRFERWFTAVPGDALRVAVLDDGTVRRLYQVAAAAALACGDEAGAFAAADRARSFSLGSLVAEAEWISDRPAAAPAVRGWRQARAAWTGAFDRRRASWWRGPGRRGRTARDLATAQADLDRATAAAEQVVPDMVGRPAAILRPTTADDVGAVLDPDTLLVEYVVGDHELQIFTIAAGTCRGVRTALDVRALQGAVRRLHTSWGGAGGPGVDRELVATLLGPVRPLLDEHARVVVVPHRFLHLMPFHALVPGHVVSQVPAASLLPRLAGCPAPRLDRASFVVGDPAFGPRRGLRRLPGAGVEAVSVARALGADALIGAAAGATAVRTGLAAAGGIAHFATHGRLDVDAPDLSALVLAGRDELTVAELLGIGLDVDLAVLSACDSGRGDITATGDVVGLARGLLAAGARHAVVSLWPVDDRIGCLTMVAMTERLVAGRPVAAALADAQRAVRDSDEAERESWYAALAAAAGTAAVRGGRRSRDVGPPSAIDLPPDHPYWWAPFVHIGL